MSVTVRRLIFAVVYSGIIPCTIGNVAKHLYGAHPGWYVILICGMLGATSGLTGHELGRNCRD